MKSPIRCPHCLPEYKDDGELRTIMKVPGRINPRKIKYSPLLDELMKYKTEHNLTVRQLSRLLSVNEQTLKPWLTQSNIPTDPMIERIEKLLKETT